MSAKLNLVLLIILGLFLAALISRNQALALMSLPFLFYIGGGLLTSPSAIRLHASRSLSKTRSEENGPVTMTVAIENEGPALPRLHILEQVWPRMRVTGGALEQCAPLPGGEKLELRYDFQAPRGQYNWSAIRVTASDFFGLFEKTLELPAAGQVRVLPGQLPQNRLRLRPRRTLRAAGPNLSRLPGAGIDFFGVREYHPGDSLRGIHWRLSARHPGQFFTREFEREEMADIGLILDGYTAANLVSGTPALFEHSIQAAAVLSKYFLRAGNRVSLLALGERILRVFPGTGKRQLVRILDELAACQPGDKVSLDTLKYLPVQLFPSHALLIVISPLRLNDFSAVARLRAAGYQVLLVSPNPVEFASQVSQQPLAIRAARLERAALLWRIRELGVEVMDWPVDEPFLFNMHGAVRRP